MKNLFNPISICLLLLFCSLESLSAQIIKVPAEKTFQTVEVRNVAIKVQQLEANAAQQASLMEQSKFSNSSALVSRLDELIALTNRSLELSENLTDDLEGIDPDRPPIVELELIEAELGRLQDEYCSIYEQLQVWTPVFVGPDKTLRYIDAGGSNYSPPAGCDPEADETEVCRTAYRAAIEACAVEYENDEIGYAFCILSADLKYAECLEENIVGQRESVFGLLLRVMKELNERKTETATGLN